MDRSFARQHLMIRMQSVIPVAYADIGYPLNFRQMSQFEPLQKASKFTIAVEKSVSLLTL